MYKQVNNENEIEKFKTTKVFLKLIEGKYNFEINLYRENQKKQFTKSNLTNSRIKKTWFER